ncbi:MAG: hypothetical protein ABFR75_05790 [Acidobacteriota bacterium]
MKKLFLVTLILILVTGMAFPVKPIKKSFGKTLRKAPQIITVKSPKGNENWIKGKYHIIKWKGSGFSNPVSISLWRNNSFIGKVRENKPGTGSFRWRVGYYMGGSAKPGDGYKIKIVEQGKVPQAAVKGESRRSFTIRKPMAIKNNTNMVKLPKEKFRIKVTSSRLCFYPGYSDGVKFKITFEPTYTEIYARNQLKDKEVLLFIKGNLVGRKKAAYPITTHIVPPAELKKHKLLPGFHKVEARVIVNRSLIIKGPGEFKIKKGILKINEKTVNLGSIYYMYTGPNYNIPKAGSDLCHIAGITITLFAQFSDKYTGAPLVNQEVFFRYNAAKIGKTRTNNQGMAKFVINTGGKRAGGDTNPFFRIIIGNWETSTRRHPDLGFAKKSLTGLNFYFPGNKLYEEKSDLLKVHRAMRFCPPGTIDNKGTNWCSETVYTPKE